MSYYYGPDLNFSDLVGKVLTHVENRDNEAIVFTTEDGPVYRLYHSQDCCESVYVEDICGDLQDLVGSPITQADESSSDELPEGAEAPKYRDDAEQWTFYRLATDKGSVVIRWYGSSNGYYSTSVSFGRD